MMKKSKTKPQMFTGAKAKQFMKFKITYFPIFSTQQKQPHLLAVFQKKLTILAHETWKIWQMYAKMRCSW